MPPLGMTVDVLDIPAEGVDREWACDAAALDLDADLVQLCGPATVRVNVRRNGREVHVCGEVAAELGQTCGRCLELFERAERLALDVVYLPASRGGDQWQIEPDEDARVNLGWYDGRRIDLRDDVRDLLLLSLPLTPICQPECRGLCERCGANLNTEACTCETDTGASPFAALDELKTKLAANPAAEQKDE